MRTRYFTGPPKLARLIGNSRAITAVRAEIEMLADSNASVLITGPSGSGKDVVAQLLHQRSRRAVRPFVPLTCAAVAPDLLESEMFGHEAGAFTGAVKARPGRFEAADGGTLFLDEIGDMALAMQAKLLRALESRVIERVGSMLPITVDVRLCAATSIDLIAAIDRDSFRSDLLYRLDVIRICMPRLADHAEDIPQLVAHFVEQLPGDPIALDDAAMALLLEQPWHGNVRELKNFVERAQAHYPGQAMSADMTARLLRRDATAPVATTPKAGSKPPPPSDTIDLKAVLARLEHACITEALHASGGAIGASAKRLGLQRTTLIEKMRRFHIGTGGLV